MIIIIVIGGSTWIKSQAPSGNWYSITSDSTGKYLAAAQFQGSTTGSIYTSSTGLF